MVIEVGGGAFKPEEIATPAPEVPPATSNGLPSNYRMAKGTLFYADPNDDLFSTGKVWDVER